MSSRVFPVFFAVLVCLFSVLGVGVQSASATFAGRNGQILFSTAHNRVVSGSLVGDQEHSPIQALVLPEDRELLAGGTWSLTGGLYVVWRNTQDNGRRIGRFDLAAARWAELQRTLSNPGRVVVSPDETHIAYLDVARPHRIVVKNLADNTEPDEVLNVDNERFSWSSRNQLVYQKIDGHIYVKTVGENDERRVVDPPQRVHVFSPGWSPDGDWVIYTQRTGGLAGSDQVMVVDREGRNRQPVTPLDDDAQGGVFSPDGQRIAYAKKANGRWQVFTRNVLTLHQVEHEHQDPRVVQVTNYTNRDPDLVIDGIAWQPLPRPASPRHSPQASPRQSPHGSPRQGQGGGQQGQQGSGGQHQQGQGHNQQQSGQHQSQGGNQQQQQHRQQQGGQTPPVSPPPNRPTPAPVSPPSPLGGLAPNRSLTPVFPPTVTALKLSRKSLPVSLKGGQLQLSLSEPAQVTVLVRKGKKTVLTIRKQAKAGKNQIQLASKRKLAAGRYQLHVTAKDPHGNTSKPQTFTFQVRKR